MARVELGAKNVDVNSYLDGQPSITLAVFQLPGANALATAESIRSEMEKLKQSFPSGIDYRIIYDTTIFIDESVHEVYKTLFEAFVLVFIVVLFFLQDWRATLMPMIDVPVSLIGTFVVMALMGFSLNNLSLFGLVLAIGIVVDDAIVVVENIERWMAKGLPPREATIKAMDEITGPVIAITLVLSAVFIPTAFIAGISGQFYRQFALTIATATIISAINALTMAPARAVQLIKPHSAEHAHEIREALPRWGIAILSGLLVYWLLAPTIASWLGLSIFAAWRISRNAKSRSIFATLGIQNRSLRRRSRFGMVCELLDQLPAGRFFPRFQSCVRYCYKILWTHGRRIAACQCDRAFDLRRAVGTHLPRFHDRSRGFHSRAR